MKYTTEDDARKTPGAIWTGTRVVVPAVARKDEMSFWATVDTKMSADLVNLAQRYATDAFEKQLPNEAYMAPLWKRKDKEFEADWLASPLWSFFLKDAETALSRITGRGGFYDWSSSLPKTHTARLRGAWADL